MWAVAVLIMVLVGFSVLYLGAHWLTDVLGGYALGAAWTALVITAAATVRQDAGPPANATATSATTEPDTDSPTTSSVDT